MERMPAGKVQYPYVACCCFARTLLSMRIVRVLPSTTKWFADFETSTTVPFQALSSRIFARMYTKQTYTRSNRLGMCIIVVMGCYGRHDENRRKEATPPNGSPQNRQLSAQPRRGQYRRHPG
jgi:hypothetical protein